MHDKKQLPPPGYKWSDGFDPLDATKPVRSRITHWAEYEGIVDDYGCAMFDSFANDTQELNDERAGLGDATKVARLVSFVDSLARLDLDAVERDDLFHGLRDIVQTLADEIDGCKHIDEEGGVWRIDEQGTGHRIR